MNRFLSYALSKKTLLIASFCFVHVVHSIDGEAILKKLNSLEINSHFLLHLYLGNNNLCFIKKAYDIDENFRRLVSQEKYGKKYELDLSVATKIALDKVCEEFFRAQKFHARIAQILAAATNVEFVNGPKDGAINKYNYSFLQLTIKKVRDILLESDPLMFMEEGFGDFLDQLDGSPLRGRITDQIQGIVYEYRRGVPEPSPSDPPPPLIVRLDQPEAASAQLAEFHRMQEENAQLREQLGVNAQRAEKLGFTINEYNQCIAFRDRILNLLMRALFGYDYRLVDHNFSDGFISNFREQMSHTLDEFTIAGICSNLILKHSCGVSLGEWRLAKRKAYDCIDSLRRIGVSVRKEGMSALTFSIEGLIRELHQLLPIRKHTVYENKEKNKTGRYIEGESIILVGRSIDKALETIILLRIRTALETLGKAKFYLPADSFEVLSSGENAVLFTCFECDPENPSVIIGIEALTEAVVTIESEDLFQSIRTHENADLASLCSREKLEQLERMFTMGFLRMFKKEFLQSQSPTS